MRAIYLVLLALVLPGCSNVQASKSSVAVDMRNVDLHITPAIALHIRHLTGQFVANGDRSAPYLDDPRSYSVMVDTGEVAVDLASLNAIMARTLKEGRSNVRSLQISVDEQGQLRQKGVVRKGIPLPFDVKASVSATPEGFIRIHSESIKGFGIPVNPLLKVLRVGMDNLFTIDAGHGVRVTGNDLLLDLREPAAAARNAREAHRRTRREECARPDLRIGRLAGSRHRPRRRITSSGAEASSRSAS